MKRDLDLARRLLLDIEGQGTDCSVSAMRGELDHDGQERIRYHLRLLIDAGLLKEIDRTSSGIPCVRLTHEGHELLELSRGESRWNEAKWICQERLGGVSRTGIRDILLRWALGAFRPRRHYVPRRWRFEPAVNGYYHYQGRNDEHSFLVDDRDLTDLEYEDRLPSELI
jgi:Hypothetical protein (DUF2513)